MMTSSAPICGEHHIQKEWHPVTFEYDDEGISIRVPTVYAWVCPVDTPETVDELVVTARELLETAKRAQRRRSVLTEYVVSIGRPLTVAQARA